MTHSIPLKLWTFWNTDKPPVFVQWCVQQMKTYNPEWSLNVISDSTVKQFVHRPFPSGFNSLTQTQRSDWVRLALLYTHACTQYTHDPEYGGVWLDASILVFSGIQCWVDVNTEYDVQGFCFPADNNVIENWAMAAPKQNVFIGHWLEEWEIALGEGPTTYCLRNRSKISPALYVYLPYLANFAAFCVARNDRHPDVKLRLLSSQTDRGPFVLHQTCNWNRIVSGNERVRT